MDPTSTTTAGRALAGARTVFLDAGNTLVSIDWKLVASELSALGPGADPEHLARAEARSRPELSRWIVGRSTETRDTFTAYLQMILERLGTPSLGAAEAARLARELAPRLKRPGRADLLWNVALPGAREALEALRDRGVERVVVSNSDGSVEQSLVRAGLRDLVGHVVDSHHVGSEKPDPAIFEHALSLSGAERARTVHVGDMYTADVCGARAAGLSAVLLDPHGDWGPTDCPKSADLRALVAAAWPPRRGEDRNGP
jgi:putative hydrolase of the HAD superfamily